MFGEERLKDLAKLLQQYLIGPRWSVTRDILAKQPEVFVELCTSTEHELRLLLDQINQHQSSVDVRITAEHLLLIVGRLMPIVSTVVADLYMTHVVDLDSADESEPVQLDENRERLLGLLRELNQDVPSGAGQQHIPAVLNSSVTLATLQLECFILLKNLMTRNLQT